MTQLELGVLPSGHLQLFSTEDNSDIGQNTGQAVIANAFARGIAEGLIALAATLSCHDPRERYPICRYRRRHPAEAYRLPEAFRWLLPMTRRAQGAQSKGSRIRSAASA